MHEASIAQTICNEVAAEKKERKLGAIRSIAIRIGALSDVDPESLRFAFDQLKRDTEFSETELVVTLVPVEIRCESCKNVSALSVPRFVCPSCASTNVKMLKGEELAIDSITT